MSVSPRPAAPRHRFAIAASALAGVTCLLVPTAAFASTRGPAAPTGVHVAAVSRSAVTIVANPAARAKRYQVYISTVKSDLYIANITARRPTRLVASATVPRVTIRHLRYVAAPYWYRFRTVNGPKFRFSLLYFANLKPATPTAVRISDSSTGVALEWNGGDATGFDIVQGTDAALTQNRRAYTLRGNDDQFSPFGLAKDSTYFYRVRAINGSAHSPYSSEVSTTVTTREQSVRVMTYNILRMASDGTMGGGTDRIAAWNTARKAPAVALIKEGNPDVISIQEGAGWVDGVRGPRQVDSVVSSLGSGYSLARTEVPPDERGYFRFGDYIIYRNSSYRTVGAGGDWTIDGATTYAAYQVLQNIHSGARLLVVAPHLTPGAGAAADRTRRVETGKLVALARSYGNSFGGLAIVYAGDFNSYLSHTHTFDGPGQVTRDAHISDGRGVAQTLRGQIYNSSNQYLRTPPDDGLCMDHIYAEPGVAIRTWRQLLKVSDGHFVGIIPSDHNPIMADLSIRY